MRTVFSSLLCASLLIHAVLGCCWHDMHDAVLATDRSLRSRRTRVAIMITMRRRMGMGTHAPCKGHPNCHGLCSYLPVQKSSFGKCLDHVVIDFAVDAHAAMRLACFCAIIRSGDLRVLSPAAGTAASLSSDPLDLIAIDSCLAAFDAAHCAVDAAGCKRFELNSVWASNGFAMERATNRDIRYVYITQLR